MAITDKVQLRSHRRIVSQLDVRIPRRAFAGSTLDVIYEGAGFAELDEATREPLLAFAEDFLDCGCDGAPFCGHPEARFVHYLLELRAEGYAPKDMIDVMAAAYDLTAYPADVLTFLDDAVRHLEAVESLAEVEGATEVAADASRLRRELAG